MCNLDCVGPIMIAFNETITLNSFLSQRIQVFDVNDFPLKTVVHSHLRRTLNIAHDSVIAVITNDNPQCMI